MSQSYRISSDLQKRVIRTLDAVRIDYQGRITNKQYALTITSRKKYNNIYTFRQELYKFLAEINYEFAVQGYAEFHNQKGRQDKVHVHGVAYSGNPPKGNRSNPFTFKIVRLEDPTAWDNYCKKEIMQTLETQHNIKFGIFHYHQKPTYLFD